MKTPSVLRNTCWSQIDKKRPSRARPKHEINVSGELTDRVNFGGEVADCVAIQPEAIAKLEDFLRQRSKSAVVVRKEDIRQAGGLRKAGKTLLRIRHEPGLARALRNKAHNQTTDNDRHGPGKTAAATRLHRAETVPRPSNNPTAKTNVL